jgi:hypothetical protein
MLDAFILIRADLLQDSNFIDDLDHIVDSFDRGAKLRFRDDKEPQFIKFGAARDNDAAVNIRFGQLKLPGYDLSVVFYHWLRRLTE